MPIDKNLPNLVINRVPTKEIYKKLKERDMINEDELYLVEDEDSDSSGGVGRQGLYETAEIFNDYENNIASGEFSHAEGCQTIATLTAAHSEGNMTIAAGSVSHAEGSQTLANDVGHAEGCWTAAQGMGSHSEGYGERIDITISRGNNPNPTIYTVNDVSRLAVNQVIGWLGGEGRAFYSAVITAINSANREITLNRPLSTATLTDAPAFVYLSGIAVGQYSHIEGLQNKALQTASHAEGEGTIAKGWAQHVQGQYNVPNENYLHIVGNGLSDDERSNAHTIDAVGNAWFSGTIKIGGNSETTGVEVATLAKAEEWVFTLEDGSTVTKKVVLA